MTRGRLAVRTAGELLITLGALVLLFVLWQLWWTDVQAGATSEAALEDLRAGFVAAGGMTPGSSGGTPTGSGAAPGTASPSSGEDGDPDGGGDGDGGGDAGPSRPAGGEHPSYGEGVAIVHLPTIDQVVAVQEGVGLDVLNRGVLGHYPHSGMPGEIGNFAVAGHRTTYGRPLWDLDAVRPGDPVVVETAAGWSVYVLQHHRVVAPDDTEVVAAVPDRPGAAPTEAWMVLTACHPRFSAAERLVGYALLDRTVPRADGPPSELGGAG